jgi:hypothetical protein
MPWQRRPKLEGHVLVLLGIAVVLAAQVWGYARKTVHIDPSFATPAAILYEHGVMAARVAVDSAQPAPAPRMAPGYPAVIALTAVLDTRAAQTLRCVAAGRAQCVQSRNGHPFPLLVVLQAAAGLVALALACFLARALSGSAEIAGTATVLTFLMGRFAEFATLMTPYALTLTLALGASSLLVRAHQRRSLAAAAGAGLLLGAVALIEIYYAVLVLFAPIFLLLAQARQRSPDYRFSGAAILLLTIIPGVVLAPWMARNYFLSNDVASITGWEMRLFAERLAYNSLAPAEVFKGLICWLPGVGDLAYLMLGPEVLRKFDLYYPGSLLLEAPHILAGAPGSGKVSQFHRLIQLHVTGDPWGYASSTVLLVLRALRATGGPLVLWGLLALPLAVRRLRMARRLGPFMIVAGPLIGLAVVQALLTSNLPWMNLPLVFVYAYVIAEVTGGLELPIGLRRYHRGVRNVQAAAST